MRLIYRNIFGVDIRFLGNEWIYVEDAQSLLFGHSVMAPSDRPLLKPLMGLQTFLLHFYNNWIKDNSALASVNSNIISNINSNISQLDNVRIPHSLIPKFLSSLFSFFGGLYCCEVTNNCLQSPVLVRFFFII